METLLCRRVELARASGHPLSQAETSVQEHIVDCEHCHAVIALDEAIVSSLQNRTPRLRASTRRRITNTILNHANTPQPKSGSNVAQWMLVAVSFSLLIVMVIGINSMNSIQSPVPPESVAVEQGEPFSGIATIVAQHMGTPVSAANSHDVDAVVYRGRMPVSLVNTLVMKHNGEGEIDLSGYPTNMVMRDASLFVLDKNKVSMDPGFETALKSSSGLTLGWGPHQVTVSASNKHLFVIVASSDGIMTAGR